MGTWITSNNIKREPPSSSDLLLTLKHIQSLFANVRKLRYRTSEFAPLNEPVISRTKSYEMVIMHPHVLDKFIASFEMSDSQLSLLGLSPATDAEWLEWGGELAEERNRREQSNLTDKP